MEISAIEAASKSIEQVNNAMQNAVDMSMKTAKKILQVQVGSNAAAPRAPDSSSGNNVNEIA